MAEKIAPPCMARLDLDNCSTYPCQSVRPSVGHTFYFLSKATAIQGYTECSNLVADMEVNRWLDMVNNMEVNKVADTVTDMEVDKVADMVVDEMTNILVGEVANMEVDKVADVSASQRPNKASRLHCGGRHGGRQNNLSFLG